MKTIVCGSDNPASFKALQKAVDKGLKVKYYLVSENLNNQTIKYCFENNIKIITDFPLVEKFDFLISFSFKRLLPTELINKSKFAINFHPAPLPYFRGRATTSQALLKNESKWGVTCHFIADKFDTGEIIERKWFEITEDLNTGKKLSEYSWELCIKLLDKIIDRILSGDTISSFKQENEGKYYSIKDLINAKKLSIKDNANIINKKIEALWYPPFEGAYIEIDGEKFYLINKKILSEISKLYYNK